MFGLIRHWRRRRILAHRAIPEQVWADVVATVPALALLDGAARERLRELVLLFAEEKRFVPAGGLELDDTMRTRIAALACRLVLELGIEWFDGILSIVVYPDALIVREREYTVGAGVVHVGDDVLSGEAWDQGPVVLAWRDVEASGRGDGYDVVAHEFAHKLDLLSGAIDGMPPLHRGMRADRWATTFQGAYDDLLAALERGEETWIDPYAAEEPAEFFAVCVELFFDVPDELGSAYPDVYAELSAFFRQAP
jgi:hypothetical protein